jgi:hypothetical protein
MVSPAFWRPMSKAADVAKADSKLIRAFAILGGVFFLVFAGFYVVMLSPGGAFPRDPSSLVVGRDFLNFWMYGRAAWSPVPWHWYDVTAYRHALADMLGGAGYPDQQWAYPPSVMMLAAPFGLMGYLPALALWSAAGLAVFAAVMRRLCSDQRILFAMLVSPAAIVCLVAGQSSLLTTATLIGIFWPLDRRRWLAGLLIGLMTLKPHLGLLIPVMLIASGRWRVLGYATCATLAIAGLTAALFGIESWTAFVMQAIPVQSAAAADTQGIMTPIYPTVFSNLHGAGLGYRVAIAVQASVTLCALIAVTWAFGSRRKADPVHLFALFVACTAAALPYLILYDTLPMTAAALLLLGQGKLDATGRVLARLVYWLPLLQVVLGVVHVPGPGLIAPVFAAYLVQRLRRGREQVSEEDMGLAAARIA